MLFRAPFRELEAQVQDLREICKSSAASRAESDRLQQDTDALVNSSPVAKIHMALPITNFWSPSFAWKHGSSCRHASDS